MGKLFLWSVTMRILFVLLIGLSLIGKTGAGADDGKDKDKPSPSPSQVRGKSLEHWIKDIHSRDRSKGETAIQAVLAFGPERAYEALPVLIGELKRSASLVNVDVGIRMNAAAAIGAILSAVKNPDPELAKDAVVVLTRMLSDTQEIVKYHAAESLARLGPAARSSTSALLTALRDPNTWKTRQAAAAALGFVALESDPPAHVMDALLRTLNDSASQVRIAALQSLSNLGRLSKRKAQIIAAVISRAQTDPEATVRIWAHMGAMNIAEKVTNEHVGAIAALLKGEDVAARVQAAQALGTIGPRAKIAVPRLIAGLKDEHEEVAIACIMGLAKMNERAEVLSALRGLLRDNSLHPAVRQAAQQAVDMLTAKGAPQRKGAEKEER
jgi:HEAT repeat protein